MGILDDVLKALDRIPVWKRLQEVPGEVDEIKSRLATLEEKLGGKWPADVCRFCGERAARLAHSLPANDQGIVREHWFCSECEKRDTRSHRAR